MGVELALAAAAAGLGAYNQHRTLRKQDQEAARGIMEQSKIQREADSRVNREIQELGQSSPEDERTVSMDQYLQRLRQTRDKSAGGLPALSGASDRYSTYVADRAAETDQYGTRVADLISRIDAPRFQRMGEGQGFGRLATDIGQLGRRSAGEDFLTRLRVSRHRPNPWIDAISNVGTSYAASRAGSKGSQLQEIDISTLPKRR